MSFLFPVRLVLRRLARQPTFVALAAPTLAIGLAANALTFAIVDAVLIRPLPFPDADRLVAIEHAAPGLDLPEIRMSELLYLHYRRHARSFLEIGLADGGPVSVAGIDAPVQVAGATVTPSVFTVLGVEPLEGRVFREEEGTPGGPDVVVVSEAFWKTTLGADPEVLGRRILVDGRARSIVGVMGSEFSFPDAETRLWIPDVVDPAAASLGNFEPTGIARLRPGIDLEAARTDLARFVDDLEATFPDEDTAGTLARAGFSVRIRPLRDVIVADHGTMLWILLATAGFVLLLAGVNFANLQLARAERTQREQAIRAALGAGPRALVTAALAEGVSLSLLAGLLGLVLGGIGLEVLLALSPTDLPRASEIGLDLRTCGVVLGLSLMCGLAFGWTSSWRSRRSDLSSRLRLGGRAGTGGRARVRVRRMLVVVQVAVALVLLVGAGLMVRSFAELAEVEPGFDSRNALSFRLSLPPARAGTAVEAAGFFDGLLGALEEIPGVRSAATASVVPLTGHSSDRGHHLEDSFRRGGQQMPRMLSTHLVSPGYFETMGIPLVRGRVFEPSDLDQRRGVVVVSESVAERFWPGEDPIGREIFPGIPGAGLDWFEVVGVVGDVRVERLTEDPGLCVYYAMLGPMRDRWIPRDQTVVVRTREDPSRTIDAVRETVGALAPDLPVAEIATLEELVRRDRSRVSFTAAALLVAAFVALLLAAVGTYGVLSYLVAQRHVELGVRMALGARREDIRRLVLREGLALAVVGGAIGLVASTALARSLRAILFRVQPLDPGAFLLGSLLLFLVAWAACAIPAHRAASVTPADALRE